MLIKSVTIANFGSMRDKHPTIRLDGRGLVAIVGVNTDDPRSSSNGAGKSTILDALDWCLFGKPPRGGKVSSVVNDVTRKNCEVEVVLGCAKGEVIVTRRMKCEPAGLTLGGVAAHATSLDTIQTQLRLEEFMGFDREVFHASVLFAQNDNLKFAEQTDAKRKELLTKMLPELALVDEWLEKAKTLAKDTEHAKEKAAAETSRRVQRLELLRGTSPELLHTQWEQQQQANIQAAVTNEEAESSRYNFHQNSSDAAAKAIPAEPALVQGEARAQLEQAQATLSECHQRRSERQRVISQHRADLQQCVQHDQRAAHSTTCPTCNQDLPPGQHIPMTPAARLVELKGFVHAAEKGLGAIEAECSALRLAIDEASMLGYREQEGYNSLVQARAQAVKYHQQTDFQMRTAYDSYRAACLRRETTQQQTNPYTHQVAQWQTDVAAAEVAIPVAQNLESELADRVDNLQWWVKALGPKGVKSHLLDLHVAALTEEVNKWVQMLTGNVCWVEFDTTTTVGKGSKERQSDKFTIRIFRHNVDGTVTEREFSQWSGGEKHRLAVAIDFGWSRLIASRAGADCAQLFLDEVFQKSLDQEGRLAMGELLKAIAPSKSSVFVVDHDTRFQGLFDAVIQVEKRDGKSTVVKGAQ